MPLNKETKPNQSNQVPETTYLIFFFTNLYKKLCLQDFDPVYVRAFLMYLRYPNGLQNLGFYILYMCCVLVSERL